MKPAYLRAIMVYFYQPEIVHGNCSLPEEEHVHCSKVFRKAVGDDIGIYDGVGGAYVVRLTEVTKKHSHFEIVESRQLPAKPFYNHLAIAPTKSMDRMEWFVEKACELGVDEITLILTKNSERNKIRIDRLEKKAISALKQSKSGYLTKINDLTAFESFISVVKGDSKYIAVVTPGLPYFARKLTEKQAIVTLIGPEGDFAPSEVSQASDHGFAQVSLGSSTLRTETAGLMAGHFVNMINSH